MTPGMFYGGWIGAILVVVHLGWSFRRCRQAPPLLRLCATFAAVVGVSTVATPVWPILSSQAPAPIENPGDLVMSLWLGTFAAIGVGAMALLDNFRELSRTDPSSEHRHGGDGVGRHGGGPSHATAAPPPTIPPQD